MRAMMDCLTEIFSQSTKVLVVRFDLHVKEHSESNQVISQFSQILTSKLKKHYTGTWFHLMWVREHGRSPKQHYHCVLMANGQKIQHPAKLIPMIDECWQASAGGAFSLPSNSYYFWKRGDSHLLGLIIYRLSYLAKNITKKRFNIKTRRYGARSISASSQLPTQTLSVLLDQ
ncbi:YagK/YfjJ domain-containing protein [Enterobacter quasihormaechei]|uniref:YagK/YfjJ domain-containing protein n=2 Tax=Enterobacteriaceae TaxID=543 RepID=UPI003D6DB796